jgi:hypothetical protein
LFLGQMDGQDDTTQEPGQTKFPHCFGKLEGKKQQWRIFRVFQLPSLLLPISFPCYA